jgi:hypothetical protein
MILIYANLCFWKKHSVQPSNLYNSMFLQTILYIPHLHIHVINTEKND